LAWLPLPSVPLKRLGPLGDCAFGSVYVLLTPTVGCDPSGIVSTGLNRSILPL
jgi:hypothetical protein